jgi:serine/threonine-protein kinase
LSEAHLDTDELTIGTVLGPYELLLPVGAGGMARVWAARVRKTGAIVALKMLLPHLSGRVDFQKMFFDEARIASRVRHPNVCATYELLELSGILTLAMEWVDGPSLMRVLRPGSDEESDAPRIPISPRLAARIVADACGGLHAAHDLTGDDGKPLAVVHRDVSPHNLLFTSSGQVKVTDFGVAKALGKSHMTMAGQLKGKLAYMSPEQLVGGTVDRRSDVFALGCVLYEITTGQKPFQGEHDPQVMAAIMMGNYAPPSALVPGYPPDLEAIVVRALANEPMERFPSADAMRQALEGWLRASGPPVSSAQIAALLEERCGADLAARRRALEPDAPASRASAESPAPRSRVPSTRSATPRAPSGERRGLGLLVTAALVGIVLGLGVLSYVRSLKKARTARANAVTSAAASISSAPTILELPDTPPAATAGALASRAPVRLHVTPPDATVLVDGVPLPKGVDRIARAEDGGTVTVTVRADRHEETLVLVDSATPDDLDVTLVPIVRRAVVLRDRDGGKTTRAVSSASASEAPPETPPNPYE